MPDFYGSDCPEPAEHDSRGAVPPSRLPAEARTDPESAAGAMVGFEPKGGTPQDGGTFEQYRRAQFDLQVQQQTAGIDPLSAGIGEAQELLRSVTNHLTSGLTAHLDSAQAEVDGCHSNICGHAHVHMDACEKAIARCNKKIDDWLVTKLATVYNLLARFGVSFAPDHELQERAGAGQQTPEPQQAAQQQQAQQAAQQAQLAQQNAQQGPQQSPQQALVGIPGKALTPLRPAFLEASSPRKPPPEYRKGDDCCVYWILWWQWLYPYLYAWLHAHHFCIPVSSCEDDDKKDEANPYDYWDTDPIYSVV